MSPLRPAPKPTEPAEVYITLDDTLYEREEWLSALIEFVCLLAAFLFCAFVAWVIPE